ncbi:hypothetical protein BGZ47_011060 [Haplosporangium gracile]|nr:hypothetical protein BGZ47_011060 [Haplosporangium gracile]
MEQGGNGVLFRFSDGTEAVDDILVGTYGAYSVVRQGLYAKLKKANKLPASDGLPLPFSTSTFTTVEQTVAYTVSLFLDEEASKQNDAFRNSEWGPEAALAMCEQVKDFADINGDGEEDRNMTLADLLKWSSEDQISKVMLEEKVFQTWYDCRAVLIGEAMEDTQSFHLIETMDTVEITLNHVDGQNIVYWEDIEQVFPGVKRVRNGNSVIKFLRSSDQQSINCRSQLLLDVVLSTSVQPILANPAKSDPVGGQTNVPAGAPVTDRVTIAFGATPPTPETPVSDNGLPDTSSSSSATSAASKATLFQQIVTRASRKARESEVEQRFISLLAPEFQETVRASSDIYQAFAKAIKDGHEEISRVDLSKELSGHFQELKAMVVKNSELQEAMNAKQEEMERLQKEVLDNQTEMKQLQKRALEQLGVLQSRVQAVLTQTYELHEYPIPRLFVVLPQDPSVWDAVNPFSNKFRLYFLCECGEHTKSISSKTKISHDIHFARHEGYEIVRPSEFFQQYGPYVLTILKMLKFGVSVAGVAVPTISHLIRSDAIDQVTAGLQQLKDVNIEPGMDHVIDWMDKASANEGEAVDEFAKQMEKKEALEGADLRKLDTFLKNKDGNKVLGNLYRTVTDEGHVKWVCIDHYRVSYQENSAKEFLRVLDSVGGSFSENVGTVVVRLRSRELSEQFFSALGKARSVYELDIDLDWACTTSDLEALEDALKKSRVSILRLDIRQFRTSNLSSTSAQYGNSAKNTVSPLQVIH